jgi:hypothetical protein
MKRSQFSKEQSISNPRDAIEIDIIGICGPPPARAIVLS